MRRMMANSRRRMTTTSGDISGTKWMDISGRRMTPKKHLKDEQPESSVQNKEEN